MAIEPLSRRSALRGAAVGVIAAVVGFVVARASNASSSSPTAAANGYGPSTSSEGKALARVEQVPVGGGIVLPGETIVLTRETGDTVHAFSATCTHQGCPVSRVADGLIDCPCHGSQFDAKTGAVVTGPASRGLPAVAVVVREGEIYRP
jgi:Rieske Fe-S protein